MRILIIDDDRALLNLLDEFYKSKGHETKTCKSAEEALDVLNATDKETFHLIISDLNLPEKSGIELIEDLKLQKSNIPIILITAYGSIDHAVKALKLGAFDYITKPLNLTELDIISKRAIKIKNLENNYFKLRNQIFNSQNSDGLLGKSPAMKNLKSLIDKVSQSSTNVLITGESGSGKEMVARAIHKKSARSKKNFIPINCAAIPPELLEAELFGYKKGAFTGAQEDRIGLFEEADGGTLFLDEIGDMPLLLQSKVLRALQEKVVKPLGGNKERRVNVRILAATHQDLKKSIQEGTFREDLFYRLCVIPIYVPTLKEREEDIPLLAQHFLKKFNDVNDKNIQSFHPDAMKKLQNSPWRGNIRELENTIERAVVLANTANIQRSDIVADEPDKGLQSLFTDELMTLKELEKKYIQYVSDRLSGKKEDIATALGINRKTLYRKEKDYDIS